MEHLSVPCNGPRSAAVHRATEFIDRHADRVIGLAEVAAAARVGPRALQMAFRRHHGVTPLGYLRRVRMQRAHQDLLHADPSRGDTVRAVSARWHFRNAGRFAVAYRHHFGRHPSAVLHHLAPEAVPDPECDVEVALLDTAGVIVWVNRAWEGHARSNGGDPARTGPGVSYLAVCESAAPDDPPSAAVASGIRSALAGERPAPAHTRMPCSTPERDLTFDVLVATRYADDGRVLGATVTLTEIDG